MCSNSCQITVAETCMYAQTQACWACLQPCQCRLCCSTGATARKTFICFASASKSALSESCYTPVGSLRPGVGGGLR